jgi:hypothetical protein
MTTKHQTETTERIESQTVGVTDQCGVCARPIYEATDVALSGVNAVLCQTCRANSTRLSP